MTNNNYMLWILLSLVLLFPIPALAQTQSNIQALVGGLIVRNPVYNNNNPNSLYFLTKTGGPQPENIVAQIKTDIKSISNSGDFTSTLDIMTKRLIGQGPNGTKNVYELKPSISIDESGSVYFGRIKQGPRGIPDFWWDNENFKLRVRGILLHERGDMPDFAIGRAGPNDDKWDQPVQALTKNTLIGKIYWWGTGPNGDFQCASGGGNNGEAAYINVEVAEDFTDNARPGSLIFATTPIGTCNPVRRMVINSEGKIGIGTGTPQAQLHVEGDALASGSWGQVSDIRLKEDIQPLSDPLDKVLGLRGISYKLKNGDNQRKIGVVAQEVEKVVPEVVQTGEDGYKSVSYQNLVPLLIEAIKQQNQKIDNLEQTVSRQQQEINLLKQTP